MNDKYKILSCEYRGDVYDLIHLGCICVVDRQGNVIHSVGDENNIICYRSSSKPIQALPVLMYDIHKKYGLSHEEMAIFSGSHAGEQRHVEILESIHKKTGLKEDDLIMHPCYPANEEHRLNIISNNQPKRKFYHNCSGKHTAIILLQRELGGDIKDYWKIESKAQQVIKSTIEKISEYDNAIVSVDGCGVPVFSVPLKNIAIAYKNLACIDTIKDERIRKAAKEYVPYMNEYPQMVRGNGFLCSLMNMDSNIVAKGGANGVYGFGLKEQGIGVSLKIADGSEDSWPVIIMKILEDLGALSDEHKERLLTLKPYNIYNDNNFLVGNRKASFSLK